MPVSSIDLQIAKKLKERISAFMPPLDFRLFGSRAGGDGDEFSDMDILWNSRQLTGI